MVVKDYLTKFVWLMALKEKTALAVATAVLEKFIGTAGIPDKIITDQGNEFDNALTKNIARLLTIRKIRTTPYNPRSDGTVEVHN